MSTFINNQVTVASSFNNFYDPVPIGGDGKSWRLWELIQSLGVVCDIVTKIVHEGTVSISPI